MIRQSLQLGRSPLIRRIVAGIILIAASVSFAFARNQGQQFWFELGANLIAAMAALVFLHYRWRAKERRAMTPDKIRDVFS